MRFRVITLHAVRTSPGFFQYLIGAIQSSGGGAPSAGTGTFQYLIGAIQNLDVLVVQRPLRLSIPHRCDSEALRRARRVPVEHLFQYLIGAIQS